MSNEGWCKAEVWYEDRCIFYEKKILLAESADKMKLWDESI